MLLAHTPHVRLTPPVKALEFDFAAPVGSGYPTESVLTLQVQASGCLNAVALFFELHLAEGVTISSGASVWGAAQGLVRRADAHLHRRSDATWRRQVCRRICLSI